MAKKGGHLCLHIVFSLMLAISFAFCVAAAAAPFWVLSSADYTWGNSPAYNGNNEQHACGITTECYPKDDLNCDIQPYGDTPTSIPIVSWRVAAILFGIATAVNGFSFLCSIMTCCFCYNAIKWQAPMLTLCTILLFSSLIAFGKGMDKMNSDVQDPEVRCACGAAAESFTQGDCELGYGVYLAIVATVITCLTSCVAYSLKRKDEEEGYIQRK